MTQNWPANSVAKLLRSFFAFIDTGVYTLLGFMYEIFFNVASADLFANETILLFYKRVQLIIGVYMVFQLAVLIMKGIFNTDTVSGKNNNEFVKKIIIALTMLTIITPISIPNARNEYEKQINNNGLLFGTLYSLQHRILNNNTIGRLVLGTNDSNTSSTSTTNNKYSQKTKSDELTKSANVFTSTILKGFFRINLVDDEKRKPVDDGKSLETLNANRMCQDIDDKTLKLYVSNDTPPEQLLTLVNATCTPDSSVLSGNLSSALTFFGLSTKTKFVFAYMPIISTVVGLIFIVLMISFSIDVAVRAVKLAVLRLIAPIPIISYMDPNGSKDSAFNSWVKTLTQTYLDLFIRLASVYFVIFLIQDMIANGIYMNITGDAVGVISFILICIGLFLFAKEAPKFIQQAMGLKNEPMNVFGQAFATGAAAVGTVGSARANYRAAREENNALHEGSPFNAFRNVGSAIVGGIAGGGVGLAAAKGKDGSLKKVLDAQSARNTRRASHSTLPGRIEDSLYFLGNGRSLATRDQATLDAASAASKSLSNWKDSLKAEARKNGRTGTFSGREFNISALEQAMQGADSNGKFNYRDAYGNTYHNLNVSDFTKEVRDAIEDDQTQRWIHGEVGRKPDGTDAKSYDRLIARGEKLYDAHNQVVYDARQANIDLDPTNYDSLGGRIGEANAIKSDMSTSMENVMHRANKQGKS